MGLYQMSCQVKDMDVYHMVVVWKLVQVTKIHFMLSLTAGNCIQKDLPLPVGCTGSFSAEQ